MEGVTQVWGSHLKQSLICIVERLSVQAIQNLRNTLRKSTRPPLNPDSEPIGCFPSHLPMIWWVRFQMGTHKTDLMWKPEAWSACKDGVRRQEKGLLLAASMKVPVITVAWGQMVSLCPHLGVEAWVLTDVTDVNRKSRGRHQLSDAVINQPIWTR